MIRIGIYGTENSHANAACTAFNVGEKGQRVRGARVVAFCPGPGDTMKHSKEVAEWGKVDHVVKTVDELVEVCDAGIVMNRHGKYHAPAARAFIEAGKPVFVDKPLTCNLTEAKRLLKLAKEKDVWISSWSTIWLTDTAKSLKKRLEKNPALMGSAYGPFDLKSRYGGHFFYGIHTVELALYFFGYDPKKVSVAQAGGDVVATVTFGSGAVAAMHLSKRASHQWAVLAWGKNGGEYQVMDSSTCYRNGFRLLVKSLKSGERPLTDEQLLAPVRVLTAIGKALKSKKTERV